MPNTGEWVVVCGWPRNGNRWIARLLLRYGDRREEDDVNEWHWEYYWIVKRRVTYSGREMTVAVSHLTAQTYWCDGSWNWHRGEAGDVHLVHVRRDPRDAFVSRFHFLHRKKRLSPDRSEWKSYLRWLDDEDPLYPVRDYYESWLALEETNPPNVAWVSHEEMRADRAGGLLRLAAWLGIPLDEERARRAGAALEAQPPRARYDGGEGQTARGTPGIWKAHFDAQDARLIEDFCGDLIVRLGYGGDPHWEALLNEADDVEAAL